MDAYIGTTPTWVSDKEKKYKDIIDKAYNDALYDFYKHAFKAQLVSDFMSEGTLPYNSENEVQQQLLLRAADNVSTKPPYMLLTVNVKPGTSLPELTKQIVKFTNRKMIRAYKYVYEVRHEDLTGLHCHLLLHYTCKPYDFKRSAKSTFKNICDSNNPNCLNFRYLKNEQIPEKIEYLKGHKKTEKMASVGYSQLYRKKHELQEMYESEQSLGTEVPLLDCVKSDELILD